MMTGYIIFLGLLYCGFMINLGLTDISRAIRDKK